MASTSRDPSAADDEIPVEVRDAAMRAEPDRYIAATLSPRSARPALAAIAAFAAEISRIPATVSEPTLGDIRLQWWRDTLLASRSSPDSTRTGHPVADALIQATRRYGPPPAILDAMIDAREFDLSGGLFPDDKGLAAYLDAVEGNGFRLALMTVGAPEALSDAIAPHAGLAYGLARGLGRLPMLLHNGGLPLPAERLRAAGLDPDALASRPAPPEIAAGVARIVADLTQIARTSLAQAKPLIEELPRTMRTAVLPLAMVEPYFRSQSGQAHLDHMVEASPLTRVVRIGLAHVTGRL